MQVLQRTFNLVAIHELKRNVGVTLKFEVNSYMKENKVVNGLLFWLMKNSEVRKLCTKAFLQKSLDLLCDSYLVEIRLNNS